MPQAELPTIDNCKIRRELQSLCHLDPSRADVLKATFSETSDRIEAGRAEHKSLLFNLKPLVMKAVDMGLMNREDLRHLIKMQLAAEQAPVSIEANEL